MSVHSQTVTFTYSEYVEVTAALELMIDHCDVMLANGPVQPFSARRQNCQAMLKKLRSAPAMMGHQLEPRPDRRIKKRASSEIRER